MLIGRLRRAGLGFAEDQATQMGAALAYYTLFSLAPLLVLGIAVLAMVLGEEGSREQVVSNVEQYTNRDIAEAVRLMLENFRPTKLQVGVWTSVVGALSLVFGASGMFTSLRSSLHRIWRLPPGSEGVVAGFVKTYLLGVVMVFVSCGFILALLLVNMGIHILAPLWAEWIPAEPWVPPVAGVALSVLVLTLLFLFTYRFLSDGKLPYRQLWFGAFVAALLFSVGKLAIGAYLGYVGLASAFGAAGSVVVFLAWVYYSAQIIFFGAEVIRAGMQPPAMSRAE
jgi:membrane protein